MPVFRLLPFIQSIPHGGLDTPPEVHDLLALDEVDIYNECDLWAEQLFDFTHSDLAATQATLATITFPIARAIIDVNRPPDPLDDPDGAIKSQSSYQNPTYYLPLSAPQREQLLDHYWTHYHTRLQDAIRTHADMTLLLLDCHNMAQRGPSGYAHAGAARPFVCIANFGNEQGESRLDQQGGLQPVSAPPWLARAAAEIAGRLFADMDLLEPDGPRPATVALNYPFAGGYIARRYALATNPYAADDDADTAPRAPHALMVEVNRGLFVGNQTARTLITPPNQPCIAAVRQRLFHWAQEVAALLEQNIEQNTAQDSA